MTNKDLKKASRDGEKRNNKIMKCVREKSNNLMINMSVVRGLGMLANVGLM